MERTAASEHPHHVAVTLSRIETSATTLTPVQDTSNNNSALNVSTQNASVGRGDPLPLFAVIGTVLSNQDDVGNHIMFGDPLAPDPGASATLVFAGWNATHCGWSWSPNASPSQLAMHVGGSDYPPNNPTFFTFSGNGVFAMPQLPNLPGRARRRIWWWIPRVP